MYFPKSNIFRVWEIGLMKAAYMLDCITKKNLVLTKFFVKQINYFSLSASHLAKSKILTPSISVIGCFVLEIIIFG